MNRPDWKNDPALLREDALDRLDRADIDADDAAIVGELPRWMVEGADVVAKDEKQVGVTS